MARLMQITNCASKAYKDWHLLIVARNVTKYRYTCKSTVEYSEMPEFMGSERNGAC